MGKRVAVGTLRIIYHPGASGPETLEGLVRGDELNSFLEQLAAYRVPTQRHGDRAGAHRESFRFARYRVRDGGRGLTAIGSTTLRFVDVKNVVLTGTFQVELPE